MKRLAIALTFTLGLAACTTISDETAAVQRQVEACEAMSDKKAKDECLRRVVEGDIERTRVEKGIRK